MSRKARNSGPVSFGGVCMLVLFLVATGAAMSVFHVGFLVAAVIVGVVVFVIIPVMRYVP